MICMKAHVVLRILYSLTVKIFIITMNISQYIIYIDNITGLQRLSGLVSQIKLV